MLTDEKGLSTLQWAITKRRKPTFGIHIWSADDEHPELRRHDVETLAGILANPMRRLPAARAVVIFDVDHHFDVRQMRRKRSTVYAALGGTLGSLNPDWPLQSQRHRAPRPARRL
jgi:hypothetical protein